MSEEFKSVEPSVDAPAAPGSERARTDDSPQAEAFSTDEPGDGATKRDGTEETAAGIGAAEPLTDDVPSAQAPPAPEHADETAGGEAAGGDSDIDESLEAAEAAMDDEEEEVAAPTGPIEDLSDQDDEEIDLQWYILKVQSNRERTSSEALKRKVAIEGLDRFFGEIIVPTEKVTEFKNGKKKIVERKIWPGYIAAQMHFNEDTWFAIRETSGIGDFTGAAGKPMPMQPHEVAMILPKEEGDEGTEDDTPKLNIKFAEGDKVKVKDGNFENFEGEVDSIDQQSGKITVMISIFGRSTPVELEYWQVETL